MLFNSNSPLRHLPKKLDKKQQRMLDGIRYSIEMYNLVFHSLNNTLVTISDSNNAKKSIANDLELYTSVLVCAWSLVDSANRLRLLLEKIEKLEKKDPVFIVQFKKLEKAKSLRNPIQHLDKEIKAQLERAEPYAEPVWGSLSWVKTDTEEPFKGTVFLFVPGAFESFNRPLINPAGRLIRSGIPINLIELSAHGHTLSLSEVYAAVIQISIYLDTVLKNTFATNPEMTETLASDVLLHADFQSQLK